RDQFLPAASVHDVVPDRTAARAFGDDCLELIGLRCRLDQHLAAHGEPDATDPLGIDVLLPLQERNRRMDVPLALPAESVGVSLALALAAAIEQQNAISVASEQLRPF